MTGLPFERWEMKVRLLSPVHVGSGWELTPDEYVLRRAANGDTQLEVVDRSRVLGDLDEPARVELNAILRGDHLRGTQDWMAKRYDPARHCRFKVQVQERVADLLRKHLAAGTSQCIVAMAARHPGTGLPYLPGSAIKGAMRTAMLASLSAREVVSSRAGSDSDDRSVQRELLRFRDPLSDPFRQIAIEDVPLRPNWMIIDQVKIVRVRSAGGPERSPSDGILVFRDVSWSLWDDVKLDAEAGIRVLSSLSAAGKVSMPIGVREIVDSCRNHYIPLFRDETSAYAKFLDADSVTVINEVIEDLGPDEAVIRIGRHSHFECMTIPKFRRSPKRGFGKSRSYVGGEIPMGWCRLSFKRIG